MINLLGLSGKEIQQKRKAFLLDFYKEINGYTRELLLQLDRRNLTKSQLKEIQKELINIESMRETFYSEIKILKKGAKSVVPKKSNFLGFSLK